MSKHRKKSRSNSMMKRVINQTGLLGTEIIGVNVAYGIAGSDAKAQAIAAKGTSLAGIPSLTYGAGTVLKSMNYLSPKKQKRKRR